MSNRSREPLSIGESECEHARLRRSRVLVQPARLRPIQALFLLSCRQLLVHAGHELHAVEYGLARVDHDQTV